MNTRIVIRRIGVLSYAKISGVLCALMGLIIGAFVSLIAMAGAALGTSMGGHGGILGAVVGVGAIIVLPILYGAIGFISGLVGGALYNLVAGMVGGIEIEGVQTSL